jgi:hypothetical protein
MISGLWLGSVIELYNHIMFSTQDPTDGKPHTQSHLVCAYEFPSFLPGECSAQSSWESTLYLYLEEEGCFITHLHVLFAPLNEASRQYRLQGRSTKGLVKEAGKVIGAVHGRQLVAW